MSNISPKIAFAIDSYTLAGNREFSIGNNADICYQSLPDNFMKVKFEGENIKWEIPDSIEKSSANDNRTVTDTLRYFKICDDNPNRYKIVNSDTCVIQIGKLQIKGSDIYKVWDSLCYKQQYVLARNIVCVSKDFSFKDSTNIRSFFYREKGGSFLSSLFRKLTLNEKVTGDISLVILDRRTSIGGQHYQFSGYVQAKDKEGSFKFQYFDLSEAMLQPDKPEKGLIAINDVHYTLKPVVVSTAWGAGHIMLRPQIEKRGIKGIKVCFPKSNMYVGDLKNMMVSSLKTSNTVSLKQRTDAFPTAYDLYVPQISKQLPTNLCLFKFDVQTPNHIQIIGEKDSIVITERSSHINCYAPLLAKDSLSYGSDKIYVRTGIIYQSFVISYLVFPLFVVLVLLLLISLPKVGLFNKSIVNGTFCQQKVNDYPHYAIALFSIFFVYAICKVFIVSKLSYTYPFFEKLTGITSTSIALMFILFVSLLAHFNFHVFKADNRKSWYGYAFATVLLFMWTGSVYYFISIIDANVNYAILDAYFKVNYNPINNISLMNPMSWKDSSAILDNHRNTVYGLIMMSFISIFALYLRCMFYGKLSLTSIKNKLGSVASFWLSQIVILLSILISGQLSNFSTAFITFFVVLGLSSALSKVEFDDSWKSRIQGGIKMIMISIIYVIAACWRDHGYMTNYIGFVLAVIAFYVLCCKEDIVGVNNEKLKECSAILFMLSAIVAIMFFVLPSLTDTFLDKDVDYDRTSRRIQLYSDFNKQREKGYRYTESDAEFMAIMSHYMVKGNNESNDPLSNEDNYLHPSVSTGQSPVVLNDLSVPIAFFGSYGKDAKIVYLSLIVLLLILVVVYNTQHIDVYPQGNSPNKRYFPREVRWNLLAVFMWAGTSFYLYLSYSGWLPFTGRLNSGMGVDSMGEALESAILMAYMASVTIKEQ